MRLAKCAILDVPFWSAWGVAVGYHLASEQAPWTFVNCRQDA